MAVRHTAPADDVSGKSGNATMATESNDLVIRQDMANMMAENARLQAEVNELQRRNNALQEKGVKLNQEYLIQQEILLGVKHAFFNHSQKESSQLSDETHQSEDEDNDSFLREFSLDPDMGQVPKRAREYFFIKCDDLVDVDEDSSETATATTTTTKTRKKRKSKKQKEPKVEKIDEITPGTTRQFEKNWISRYKGDCDISIQPLLENEDRVRFDYYHDGRKIEDPADLLIPLDENGNPAVLYKLVVNSYEVEVERFLAVKCHVSLAFKESYVRKKPSANADGSSQDRSSGAMAKFAELVHKTKEKWILKHCPAGTQKDCTSPSLVDSTSDHLDQEAGSQAKQILSTPEGDARNRQVSKGNPEYVDLGSCNQELFRHTKGGWTFTSLSLKKLFHKSILSPSLLAYVMVMRFVLIVPNSRIARHLWNMGLCCPECTVSNWKHLAAVSLKPLSKRLRKELKKQGYAHGDETPALVFREPGRSDGTKSYFWVYCSIDGCEHPVCLWVYHPGRKGEFAQEDLSGWMIKLIRDAYQGYHKIDGIIAHCLCNSHARRYFWLASKNSCTAYQRKLAAKVVSLYDKLFQIERELKNCTPEERLSRRSTEVADIMDMISSCVTEILNDSLVIENGQLHRAAAYFRNNEVGLREFLKDPNVPATNNKAERMVKPFALYRRNTLFFGSPQGAEDAAIIMSVIRSAELNGLDPEKYLAYVWERLRGSFEDLSDDDEEFLDSLLPWADGPQRLCKAIVNPRCTSHSFEPVT